MAESEAGAEIGAEREFRIVARIARDYVRLLHERHDLIGRVEIALVIDPSPRFGPHALLLADGAQQIVLTRGTYWWAWLCARAIARHEAGLDWPEAVPRAITRPRHVPGDAEAVRRISAAFEADMPPESDGFFVFLFVTFLFAVIFHELGHVLRGHLRLLAAAAPAGGSARPIGMLDDGSGDDLRLSVARRVLEYDADAVAGFLYGELMTGPGDLYPIWARNSAAENLAWSLVGFALFSCGIADAAPGSGAYPDPFSRYLSFFYGARQYAAVRLEEDPSASQASIDCFNVLASIEADFPQVADFRELADDAGLKRRTDEFLALMDEMPALNRLLAPYWSIASSEASTFAP